MGTVAKIFGSGIFGKEVKGITVLEGSTATKPSNPCPNCGQSGKIMEGTADSLEEAGRILLAPGRTANDIAQLIEVLRYVERQGLNRQETVEEITIRAPKFFRLGQLMPHDRAELYGFLSLLATLASLMVEFYSAVVSTRPSMGKFGGALRK